MLKKTLKEVELTTGKQMAAKRMGVERRSWNCEGWNQDVASIRRRDINIKILYLCCFLRAIGQRCGYVLTPIFPLCNVIPEDDYSQQPKHVVVTVLYVITGAVLLVINIHITCLLHGNVYQDCHVYWQPESKIYYFPLSHCM